MEIKGVGESLATKFGKLGISTINDLLRYYPRKYEDYSQVTPIAKLKTGQVTILGSIKQAKGRWIRGGLHITEAVASDDTGSVRLVWFNQPYRANAIKPDTPYYISGNFELNYRRLSIMNPSMELVSSFPVNTARIVPVYPASKGITSLMLRKAMREAFLHAKITETLPGDIIAKHALMPLDEALYKLHFPADIAELDKVKHRLGFEEVFTLMLASALNKQDVAKEKSVKIPFDKKLAQEFVNNLPFKLTDGQKKAAWEIYQDIDSKQPMNRLLEGDVGAGKTVVAAMAAIMAMQAGYQVAFMAPTEILARQHAESLYQLLKPLGLADDIALIVGAMKGKEKAQVHFHAKAGEAKLLIGTHALIQEKLDLHNLGLVIIDEQHRFGVEQRKRLLKKAGHMPHMLSMTATPIPRSLALTVYGEMDISILDAKPKNRKPIITEIIGLTERPKLYKKLEQELEKGRQIFVVSPLIESSESIKAKSAEEVFEGVKKVFPHRRVGLLHGRMKTEDKQAIMQDFVDHKIDVLASTTVIEVGVDVPNASVMLIEGPERFGLAQIHQLRGRVGRGDAQGYCYLLLSDSSAPSRRIKAVAATNDGFKLAELDLEIRGPGALFGTSQHGELDLRIAKLTDTKLLAEAKKAANDFINSGQNLLQYQELYDRVQHLRSAVHLN